VSFQFKYLGEVGADSKEKNILGGWKVSSMKQFKPKNYHVFALSSPSR
jgi:hypothetical protein